MPLKPLILVRVIRLVADELGDIVNEDGFDEMEKSPVEDTVNVRIVECDKEPTAPVTLIVYVPIGVEDWVETVRIDVVVPPDERLTLEGLSEADGPEGEDVADSVTVPEKPFRLESVIVLVPDEPCESESEDGLSVME